MNISITPELEELINKKVKSGMYHSASEVIREALRLLKEKDELKELRLKELRSDIQTGFDDERTGHVAPLDLDAVKSMGRKRLAAKKKAVHLK